MIVIRVCWRSQWHTLHTRSRAQCAQVTLPIVDHRRQRGTFALLQLLLQQPNQGKALAVLLLLLMASSSYSATNGPGPTILLWSGRSKCRCCCGQLSGHRSCRRRRRRGGGGGVGTGTDLLVNVGHFSRVVARSFRMRMAPDRFHRQGRWRFVFFLL